MSTVLKKLKLGFLVSLLVLPFSGQIALAQDDDDGQRAPPEARTSGTLSQQVMRAVTEIQEMMSPEDEEDEPDLEGAKRELDELRERRWDRMNDFEKSTVLNFYTNYYLSVEDYANALLTFEEILTIEELREDTRLRTLRSLGQLYMAEERWQEAIGAYDRWRELSPEEDIIVYRGLSYSYYQQEMFEEALPYWIDYMNLSLETGEELGRDDYAYLNGIYFTLEDFDSALELTKTMIVLFDNQTDWMNLSAVYASLDNEERRVQSLNVAYLKGYVDDENRYLNLGQSMAGIEAPWSGADILVDGVEKEIVEENQDNLEILSQMYLVASAYEEALEPALQVAELSDSGDGWDTVGYIHYVMHNYEEAVEAFERAIDIGNLSDRSDTLLFLSRARIELDDFDGALEAARQAADAGDENAREAANNYITFINTSKQRYDIIQQRKQESIEYYQPYPSLL
jgi:tetratricopeptide (TPR) repeat protein